MTPAQVHLEYATDTAPRAGRVRAALLVAGVVHAAAALTFVGPDPLQDLLRAVLRGMAANGVPRFDRLVSGVAFVGASFAFLVVCAAAALWPDGRATPAVRLTAITYLAVWLIDGARETIFQASDVIYYYGHANMVPAAAVIAGAAAREAGQVSLLALVAYAFGRRAPDASRVTRGIARAAAAACGLQFAQRVADLVQQSTSNGVRAPLPPGWLLNFARLNWSDPGWTIGITAAVSAVLVLPTYRRWPRIAGMFAVLPLVLAVMWLGQTWWADASGGGSTFDVGRVAALVHDLAFAVVGATAPVAAFLVFTILGQTAARPAGRE